MKTFLASSLVPGILLVAGAAMLVSWANTGPLDQIQPRVRGLDDAPPPVPPQPLTRPVVGQPVRSQGAPAAIAGAWPCFRGARGDAICSDGVRLARRWPEGGPKRLWSVELGEGYAAAAVSEGCVYVLDHVLEPAADTLRCLSLDDGREIWRNSYPAVVPPHHGMSRTIPAVMGKYVVSLGPLCHVVCWDADTGRANWLIDLVHDHGATVPEWYAGQCPLIDAEQDQLVLAPGGKALLIAVDYKTGKVKWESPNPRRWTMTHSSIVPMTFAGRKMYVYCGKGGVAGVSVDDGAYLWDTTDWRIDMATCPSPVVVGDGKIFFCGGYNAGALMLQLREESGDTGDRIVPQTLFRLTARQFSSEQQTPVFWEAHLYGVRQKDQQLVCLDLQGKELWNSGREKFGAAPYMIADGLIYALNDAGKLTIAEANPNSYKPLAAAQVIDGGVTCWGPMAMVAGRLIVRDFSRMVCLDVAEGK